MSAKEANRKSGKLFPSDSKNGGETWMCTNFPEEDTTKTVNTNTLNITSE